MKASSQAADWADTLSIYIHPIGTLAKNFGHQGNKMMQESP